MTNPVEQARRRIYDLCDEYGIVTRPLVEELEKAIRTAAIAEAEARLEQARTAMQEYSEGAAECEYDTIDGQPDMFVCTTHGWMGTCPIDAIRKVIAALKKEEGAEG